MEGVHLAVNVCIPAPLVGGLKKELRAYSKTKLALQGRKVISKLLKMTPRDSWRRKLRLITCWTLKAEKGLKSGNRELDKKIASQHSDLCVTNMAFRNSQHGFPKHGTLRSDSKAKWHESGSGLNNPRELGNRSTTHIHVPYILKKIHTHTRPISQQFTRAGTHPRHG